MNSASGPKGVRFINCLNDETPLLWRPSDKVPVERSGSGYFDRVLEVMARELVLPNLTIYLTRNTVKLPSVGRDVVAVVFGDEKSRVPAYTSSIRAVFKDESLRPHIG